MSSENFTDFSKEFVEHENQECPRSLQVDLEQKVTAWKCLYSLFNPTSLRHSKEGKKIFHGHQDSLSMEVALLNNSQAKVLSIYLEIHGLKTTV